MIGDPRDRPDLRHHHRRHRPVGRRGGRLRHASIVAWLLTQAGIPDLGRRHPRSRLADRLGIGAVPRLRHRAAGPAALHHDAGDADALRGIGLLITNGATISITNDAFTGVLARRCFSAIPNLFWMVILVAVPAYHLPAPQPLGPLSLRGRLQRGGGAAVRRQRQARMIYLAYIAVGALRCLRRRAARRRASASATRPRPKAGSCRRSRRR